VLEPLPPVQVEAVGLVSVPMELARPLRTSQGTSTDVDVLLVHVRAAEAEGWAEVAVEAAPTYAPEFRAGERLALLDHLVPLAWEGPTGDAVALGAHLAAVRGHHPARAALQLAVLDAQLRAADRSLATWLGATAERVPVGAALSLAVDDHGDLDEAALTAEADAALAAGASRLRLKVAPGTAAAASWAVRSHVGSEVVLQADANGSFRSDDPDHLAELGELDDVGLACLEQPFSTDDLLGHARLAERLATPICLDEPLTSVGALEAAVALGACGVACLKPARVGGWPEARRFVDRCGELGVPVWIGGMLESGIGRAANLALAAYADAALPMDLDPRPRFVTDLADPLVAVDGRARVPAGAGTGATPDWGLLASATMDRLVPR
jgi:O-succinylbenzoate synthase